MGNMQCEIYVGHMVFETDRVAVYDEAKKIPANISPCTLALGKPMQAQQTWNISVTQSQKWANMFRFNQLINEMKSLCMA